MSVRSLTLRLAEERREILRRSPDPTITPAVIHEIDTTESVTSAFYKGNQPEPDEETPDVLEQPEKLKLKPRIETPLERIPGGIRNRFGLKSQRMSEISRSIDAYTSQVTAAESESEDDEDERGADSTPITIELQSH